MEVKDREYIFGFDKMKRWIDLCKVCGIEYFEMSHLFSQWGAKYAPKVVAVVDGKEEKIFGWHTPAVGEYTRLLESFKAAKESPGNNEFDEFLEHGLTEMWTYYCTGQFYEVSNRFMYMPSARNRIYGVQLFKYNIIGILHWGYNFYNSQFSIEHINPYEVTDEGNAFPAGDPFLVYPGADGHPEESVRMMVHYEALTDLRALELLESLTSKEYVIELIEGELAEPLTFKRYPKSDMYLITLRNRVNREIAKRL